MPSEDRLLRLPAVLERVGVGKTKLYAMMKDRGFPPPTRLGHRTAVWPASAVSQWIDAQSAA